MKFPTTAFFTAATLIPGGVLAALLPKDVVINIRVVTTISGNIASTLTGLTTSTGPSEIANIGQTLVAGFTEIIKNVAGDIVAMQATPPLNNADAGPIADALREVILCSQTPTRLLSIVIGKHSIFAQFALTVPIVAVLRSLEGAVDSFAYAMITLIPTKQISVTSDLHGLDVSVDNTIAKYGQICIPSLLYPTALPICIL
ncbi:hypothetical protein DFH08DRAFT_694581 [Mycena albidolilacea]|uniref:Uncharacterized protein n=1 Tax=Mycena albidolilacea TaxID=1033008 RepID=A0AAD7A7L1_9AGAR|nr:hypothetical protein DFH08DRAFT_694581 [Mycena albidolilacea]